MVLVPSVAGEGVFKTGPNCHFFMHYQSLTEQYLSVSNNLDSHRDLHRFPELSLLSLNNLFASVIALQGFHDIQGVSLQHRS